ncbi:MAG: RNA polymerase sigma factor [Endomicrobiia bacterium]
MNNEIIDDDIRLMLNFQKGDESCFEKLLDKYEKPLLNFIYRFVGNQTDAEDLTQEVFLKIYKAKNRYKPQGKFSNWLYKIAIDLCIDYQRKRKIKTAPLDNFVNTQEREILQEIPDLSQITPEISVEKKQISQIIRSALLSLPARQRLALTLKIYENKSYQEISKILDCSVSAVESLLFRARLSLRNKLSCTKIRKEI